MNVLSAPRSAIVIAALIATVPISEIRANTNSPTIRLFPTTVVEDLRQTSSVAQEMESGLQEVIGRLDQQQQLYVESKCDGAEDDPGCQRLAKQLGATYLDMLGIMMSWTTDACDKTLDDNSYIACTQSYIVVNQHVYLTISPH